MRRYSPLALAVLLVAVGPPAARAQMYPFDDITVTAPPDAKGNSSHGYTELTYVVQNKSDVSHKVRLFAPRYNYSPSKEHIREISRTAEVGPNASVRMTLYIPDSPDLAGNSVGVSIDGRTQDINLRLNYS